jgi:hypothetical protein
MIEPEYTIVGAVRGVAVAVGVGVGVGSGSLGNVRLKFKSTDAGTKLTVWSACTWSPRRNTSF